jgi:hypothetical protein
MQGDQAAFLDEVRTFHTYGTFARESELVAQVLKRLRAICAEEVSPWCKLGSAIFRTTKMTRTAKEIIVDATVKDNRVIRYLEGLDERRQEVRFTHQDGSATGTIDALSVEVTATRSRFVHLSIRINDSYTGSLSDVSFSSGTSTYSPDDLTELALRSVLFGEDPGLGLGGSSLLPKLNNPLMMLPRISEEIIRPLARLLLVEDLVGQGRADSVVTLRIGAQLGGEREVLLGWLPPGRYAEANVSVRGIRGRVSVARESTR